MNRAFGSGMVWGMVLVLASRATAQDKVYSVGKNGLRIEGIVAAGDPKVKIFLNPNSKLGVDLPAKSYLIKLSGGKIYQIDMTSEEIGPFLVVQDEKGLQLAFDDDSGGDLNARLLLTLPKNGTYKVFAASLKGAGRFTLTVGPPTLVKAHVVGQGLKIEGKLARKKTSIVYQVFFEEGSTYVIDMLSPDPRALDPFLKLLDKTGKVLARDDDSGGGLNARITFKAPATGRYQIVATSFGARGVGDFTLEVKEKE
jgi:serine protease Do